MYAASYFADRTENLLHHAMRSNDPLLPSSQHLGCPDHSSKTPKDPYPVRNPNAPFLPPLPHISGSASTPPTMATDLWWSTDYQHHDYHSRRNGSRSSNDSLSNTVDSSPFSSFHRRISATESATPDLLHLSTTPPSETSARLSNDPLGTSQERSAHTTIANQEQPSSLAIPFNNSPTPSIATTSTSPTSPTYYTWLVFLKEQWVPFDGQNQARLEQTLSLGGTFVDITDSHFPNVRRVRVFPKNNYLSYLGVKYQLSRIMQPDAWLDSSDVVLETKKKSYQG